MVKIITRLLFLLTLATPAFGQSIGGFNVPSDLTGMPGGGYTAVPPQFKTDGTQNTVMDPTVNIPPAYAYELPNIPVPSLTGRVVTEGPYADAEGGFCTEAIFGGTDPGCQEAKFRTHADFTHCAPDDPVRNARQPGKSHFHCFFGAGTPNAYSTYASLRHHSLDSAAVGTDANGTGYWYPAVFVMNAFGDGKNYALPPDWIIIYYVGDPARKRAHLVRGLRYVFGYNMDDGGAWLQAYLDAANTASGSTRYIMSASPPQHGGAGGVNFNCVGATAAAGGATGFSGQSELLTLADGSDPFGGTCNGARVTGYVSGTTLTVTAVTTGTVPTNGYGAIATLANKSISSLMVTGQLSGTAGGVGTYSVSSSATIGSSGSPVTLEIAQDFYIGVAGPDCWDGTNYWSPGGYKHIIPKIRDTLYSTDICPSNYYEIPHIVLEIHFTQHGWTDRQKWDLSSDIAKRAATGKTTAQLPPGSTFHTDWMNGWDDNIMQIWEQNCLGTDGHQAHQCSTSTISSTQRLQGGFIGGEAGVVRNPQVDASPVGSADQANMILVAPSYTGAMTNMVIKH